MVRTDLIPSRSCCSSAELFLRCCCGSGSSCFVFVKESVPGSQCRSSSTETGAVALQNPLEACYRPPTANTTADMKGAAGLLSTYRFQMIFPPGSVISSTERM